MGRASLAVAHAVNSAVLAVDVGGAGWYVGVTGNPLRRLRCHGVRTGDAYRVQRCQDGATARSAMRRLIAMGYTPSIERIEGEWLYVYAIQPWTNEDLSE